MNRIDLGRFFACTIAVWALSPAASAGQWRPDSPVTSSNRRIISFQKGTEIRRVLRTDDTQVVIERLWSTPDLHLPNGYTPLAWKTVIHPIILIVRISRITGALTTSGDWIESQVEGVVEEVLKNQSSQSLSAGTRVVFTMSGGDAQIDGKSVSARFRGLSPLQSGGAYLVFGLVQSDSTLRVAHDSSYQIGNGRITTLDRTNRTDPVEQTGDLDHVRSQISANASIPPPVRKKP